jgi:hypothetical protein
MKRLINTAFSQHIDLIRKHSSKNNVIWFTSKTSIIFELQTVCRQKYSPGVLVYGEVSSHSLILKASAIFIDKWLKSECKKINKQRNTMVKFLLYIKHRSHYVLEKIDEIFL